MKKSDKILVIVLGAVAAMVAFGACAKTSGEAKDRSSKATESTVTTNDNGSVSRVFTESTVTTNGNMVTEHRRETRTNMDMEGNVLETSTSEYAQTYAVGDTANVGRLLGGGAQADGGDEAPAPASDTFLGLKFGETFEATNFVTDVDEPTLRRATFTPAKPLAGFDDYYVYVTPTTHRIAKVYACAREAVEPGARWRRHYLIEALEKRYQTWARLCSFSRPCYAFDLGGGRYVSACLADATCDYETVISAWDEELARAAVEEQEEIARAARKEAAERRSRRVNDAAEAC